MRPDERDAAYIWDMLDSAKTLQGFITGVSFYNYSQDKKLQLAVERALEIIGEAARRVSETYRQAHPEISWQSIIAQRNVLAHEYGAIKHELIWKVATTRIPELISLLEKLIPDPPDTRI
jgi:uncharacterized protein with HEPN domain